MRGWASRKHPGCDSPGVRAYPPPWCMGCGKKRSIEISGLFLSFKTTTAENISLFSRNGHLYHRSNHAKQPLAGSFSRNNADELVMRFGDGEEKTTSTQKSNHTVFTRAIAATPSGREHPEDKNRKLPARDAIVKAGRSKEHDEALCRLPCPATLNTVVASSQAWAHLYRPIPVYKAGLGLHTHAHKNAVLAHRKRAHHSSTTITTGAPKAFTRAKPNTPTTATQNHQNTEHPKPEYQEWQTPNSPPNPPGAPLPPHPRRAPLCPKQIDSATLAHDQVVKPRVLLGRHLGGVLARQGLYRNDPRADPEPLPRPDARRQPQ